MTRSDINTAMSPAAWANPFTALTTSLDARSQLWNGKIPSSPASITSGSPVVQSLVPWTRSPPVQNARSPVARTAISCTASSRSARITQVRSPSYIGGVSVLSFSGRLMVR